MAEVRDPSEAGTRALRALEWAESGWAGVLGLVEPTGMARPSGCDGWSVRDLINHVNGGGHRYTMLLEGADANATATTRAGDYVDDAPVGMFWRYENQLRAVVERADLTAVVDHRMGPRTGLQLVHMRVMDVTLHTKDLCDGLDTEWQPTPELCEFVLDTAAPIISDFRASGLFGPACEPASDSAADRLLSFTGRAGKRPDS